MKFKNKVLPASEELVFIVRGTETIEIKCIPIEDGKFSRLVAEPKPKSIRKPGGLITKDVTNPDYIKAMSDYSEMEVRFLFISSLRDNPNMEWDKLDPNNPDTWVFLDEELMDFGLLAPEVSRIWDAVFSANAISSEKIEKAKQDFYALQD